MAAQQLQLDYPTGSKAASLFELPWPSLESAPIKHKASGWTRHKCGAGKHWYKCPDPARCTLEYAYPCTECLDAVKQSYRAGRYCSR
jgi:hypothetical protein